MTEHPIDTEALRRLADAATEGPWEADHSEEDNSSIKEGGREWWDGLAFAGRQPDAEFIAAARTAVPTLLDALAAAEHRVARLEAQTDIRGRAVVMYRERAREAEAERDEWRQTALDERAAALDALEQIKAREARAADIWDEAHEVGWNNADEYWRCDGLIPAYHKADTYPNPYRASETA